MGWEDDACMRCVRIWIYIHAAEYDQGSMDFYHNACLFSPDTPHTSQQYHCDLNFHFNAFSCRPVAPALFSVLAEATFTLTLFKMASCLVYRVRTAYSRLFDLSQPLPFPFWVVYVESQLAVLWNRENQFFHCTGLTGTHPPTFRKLQSSNPGIVYHADR